jgi:hypothetical protein
MATIRKSQIKGLVHEDDLSDDFTTKFNKLYKERKSKLNFIVKSYLWLRKYMINPIEIYNDKSRLKTMIKDMKMGEIKVRS